MIKEITQTKNEIEMNKNQGNPINQKNQGSDNVPELRFPDFVNEDEWEEKALGDVAEIITGSTPNTKEIENYGGQKLFVSPADINGNRYISQTKTTLTELGFSKTRQIKSNSVLFVCIGSTIGKVAQNKIECATNQQINSLISHKEYSNDFLYSSLENSASQISKLAGIQALPIINKSQFSAVKLLFPNLEEQQKIASCLSSLDEVIAAHSQKLELLKDHKKGLMQNLFPQEGEKVPKLRFKEFEKDGEWAEKKLGEVAENVMYGMNSAAVEYDGHNKYIRITDIDENSRLFLPNPLTSPDGQLEEKYIVNVGDLLFARTGASVGKSYLHQKENGKIYFAGFLIRFTLKNAIPYFLYAQTLTEQYQKWVLKTSMRSGQPGINAEEYKSYPIFLPPTIEEQQKIASCLSALDELITAQAEKIGQLKQHKKGLMQGLFPKMNEI